MSGRLPSILHERKNRKSANCIMRHCIFVFLWSYLVYLYPSKHQHMRVRDRIAINNLGQNRKSILQDPPSRGPGCESLVPLSRSYRPSCLRSSLMRSRCSTMRHVESFEDFAATRLRNSLCHSSSSWYRHSGLAASCREMIRSSLEVVSARNLLAVVVQKKTRDKADTARVAR